MKKNNAIYAFAFFTICLTSCATITGGITKPISLVDAPKDIEIRNLKTGKIIPITTELAASRGGVSSSGASFSGGQRFGPAIRLKIKKGMSFEIRTKDTVKIVEIGHKNKIGFLIAEGIPTLGTFALVDILTGANKHPNPDYIDVKSVLANKPQRGNIEIWNYIWENWSATKK